MSTNTSQAAGWNVTTWDNDQRRMSSFVVLGLALALVLAGIATWYFVSAPPAWLYWALVGALALVLVFLLVVMFVPAKSASATEAAVMESESATAPAVETPAPVVYEPRVLTLRCGDCGTIFDVTDTGERPLYHTCPGCGAEGALRDEPVAAAAQAEPEPAVAPEQSQPRHEAMSSAALAMEPAPMAPPVKKLKLRCGGCKEVFSIEDTGERPLKRGCPHCGRMGQIN